MKDRLKLWVVPFISCSIIFFLFFFFLMIVPENFWAPAKGFLARYILQTEYIAAKNQPLGDQLVIEAASFKKPGFLVVVFENRFGGPNEYVVGVSSLLSAGAQQNVSIPVAPNNFIRETPPPPLLPGTKVFVSMFYDDGDGQFTLLDEVVKDIRGYPLLTHITLW